MKPRMSVGVRTGDGGIERRTGEVSGELWHAGWRRRSGAGGESGGGMSPILVIIMHKPAGEEPDVLCGGHVQGVGAG